MNDGILLNGVITLTGGAGYLSLLRRLVEQRADRYKAAQAILVFSIGAHLSLAGLRQVVAAMGQSAPGKLELGGIGLLQIDMTLFHLASIVAAFTAVALAFLACEAAGKPKLAVRVGFALTVLAAFGITLLLRAPLEGPTVSYWGTDWVIADPWTRGVLVVLIGTTAAASLAVLFRTRRAPMLALAVLVYYAAIIPDALGLAGIPLMAARIAAASSALLAWEAVRVPYRVPAAEAA